MKLPILLESRNWMMPGKRGLELVVWFVKTLRLVILAGREVNQTPKMRFPWVPGS